MDEVTVIHVTNYVGAARLGSQIPVYSRFDTQSLCPWRKATIVSAEDYNLAA